MKPVILDAAGDGELPLLRWRTLPTRLLIYESVFGIIVVGPPEWALHVYVGRWLIGIERTREED